MRSYTKYMKNRFISSSKFTYFFTQYYTRQLQLQSQQYFKSGQNNYCFIKITYFSGFNICINTTVCEKNLEN
jgi:hypothetical protein